MPEDRLPLACRVEHVLATEQPERSTATIEPQVAVQVALDRIDPLVLRVAVGVLPRYELAHARLILSFHHPSPSMKTNASSASHHRPVTSAAIVGHGHPRKS